MLFPKACGVVLLANFAPLYAQKVPFPKQLENGFSSGSARHLDFDQLQDSYSIEQVYGGPGKTAFEKIKHDFHRWRGQVPEHILKREAEPASPTVTGTVQATPRPDDAEYYIPLKIESQTFHVILDTGSSDFWVWSKELPKADWGTHSIYKETGTKYTNPAETWDISYADGSSASGNVWFDNITLGGIKTGIAVEAATQLSSSFLNGANDGLIGFAYDVGNTCSPYQCYTFMDLVETKLKNRLFTSTLRKGKPGTYDFGYIDPAKYTGTLAYTPVDNSSSYWGFTSSGYAVGSGKKVTYSQDTIADTGTVLIYVPTDVVNAYYASVKGAFQDTDNFIYYPCADKLPNFSLYIGSHKATVPGSYLSAGATNSTGKTCLGGIQDGAIVGSNIVGDYFLKSQFVVYDRGVPRLGWAQQPNLPSS